MTMTKTNPIAEFARALNPPGGALADCAPFSLTAQISRMDAPEDADLFELRVCRDCGRTIDTGGLDDCLCPSEE